MIRTKARGGLWKVLLISLLGGFTVLQAQQRVDGEFPFQTEPAKGYSIYIPSNYVEGVAHRLMVGMHPLNPARWNSISWCDTLIVFAEQNGLLLVCPDGGANGSVDDPIDTAFTTVLLDSVRNWYSVDDQKTYIMGFSVGGRVTYTYGLSNTDVFAGFLPIGAAITNLNEVDASLQANSEDHPVYIVHGSLDAPSIRYTPVLNALTNSGAIVNSILMSGVGHTIDFPDRNEILGFAFQWVDSVNCAGLTTGVEAASPVHSGFHVLQTVLMAGQPLVVRLGEGVKGPIRVTLIDRSGKVIMEKAAQGRGVIRVTLPDLAAGIYVVRSNGEIQSSATILILDR